jgi:hypothetical protein
MHKKESVKKTLAIYLKEASDFISKNRLYFLIGYFAVSAVLFSLQFDLLRNWDMLTRILNANYMFHNGFYFEPERALLESFVVGVLSFVMGAYAVYGFMVIGAALLVFALSRFAKAFSVDQIILIALFLNPFFLIYGAMNGSEIFVLAFLVLYLAELKNKSYLAGVFLALAFVSKYYALYFAVMLLFMFWGGDMRKSIMAFFGNVGTFLLVLIPFFAYNAVNYGNIIYTFALSYLNFGIEAGRLPYFVYTGLLSLFLPAALLILVFSARWKSAARAIKDNSYLAALLAVVFAIGVYLYYSANGLMVGGLDTYRWAIVALSFSMIFVATFLKKKDIPAVICLSAVFFIIAFAAVIMEYQPLSASLLSAQSAVGVFQSLYNTTNCTVYSNNWIPLDYYGLPASAMPSFQSPYDGHPIVSFGPADTSFPLLYNKSNIYVYGNISYCNFNRVNVDFILRENGILQHENKSLLTTDACAWLFGMSPDIPALKGSCDYVNSLIR